MRRTLQLLLALLLSVAVSLPCLAAQRRAYATLSGAAEVPAVKTEATGDLKLLFYKDGVSFELNLQRIRRPTGAYIHKGKPGENGPPVAGLFGGPTKEGTFNGILAEGVITEESLLGEMKGKRWAELIKLLKSGNAYVNVLTETFPGGEIRGQITQGVALPDQGGFLAPIKPLR